MSAGITPSTEPKSVQRLASYTPEHGGHWKALTVLALAPDVTLGELKILANICSLLDEGGPAVAVSRVDLSTLTNLSIGTVIRSIRRLEERGILHVDRPPAPQVRTFSVIAP